MSPDDPRHGTYAGAGEHYKSGERPCEACRKVERRVRKKNRYLELVGRSATVSSLGTARRLNALRAIGWNLTDVARESGIPETTLRNPLQRSTIYRSTAERVAEAYERLSATYPPGAYADRCRNDARRKGWLPPSAWLNIDDPNEQPDPGYRPARYTSAELVAEWDHLRRAGVSIYTAASQLGVTVGAIEKAIERSRKVSAA